MVAEVFEVERKTAVGLQRKKLSHLRAAGRIAIGGKPHQLVLVAVMRKSEILRHGLVEDAERMRKQNPAVQR